MEGKDIKFETVESKDIKTGTLQASDIKPKTITWGQIGNKAILTTNLADGLIGDAQVAPTRSRPGRSTSRR